MTASGFRMDETGKSVGSRLIRTFGAQLGGVSSVRSEAGQGHGGGADLSRSRRERADPGERRMGKAPASTGE